MDQPRFIEICNTEQRAFDYPFSQIQETNGMQCPSCTSTDYYLMNPKRLRCRTCRRDHHPFYSTPLSRLKILVISLLLPI